MDFMVTETESALWRRLDTPGHDAAWLMGSGEGWWLRGTAVFRHDGAPACLAYEVACDRAWVTRRGAVRGRIGDDPVEYVVVRTDGGVWTLNEAPIAGLDDLVDLDFGFTPATNLQQLRRVRLAVGQSAEVPVAWLDTTGDLVRLPQRYERRTETTYWYEAPSVGYAAALVIGLDGFVRSYPSLWEAERGE
jgi:hypothetical protein